MEIQFEFKCLKRKKKDLVQEGLAGKVCMRIILERQFVAENYCIWGEGGTIRALTKVFGIVVESSNAISKHTSQNLTLSYN
jgi:hypothetical protein